jgi:hypothetical protein
MNSGDGQPQVTCDFGNKSLRQTPMLGLERSQDLYYIGAGTSKRLNQISNRHVGRLVNQRLWVHCRFPQSDSDAERGKKSP